MSSRLGYYVDYMFFFHILSYTSFIIYILYLFSITSLIKPILYTFYFMTIFVMAYSFMHQDVQELGANAVY